MFGTQLLAQSATTRTYYEFMRLRHLDQWWHWFVAALVLLVLLAWMVRMVRHDARSLASGTRWLLSGLRLLAVVGIVLFLADLQRRVEQKVVKNSRFALLVDTSQSMGIRDPAPSAAPPQMRMAEVLETFGDQDWWHALLAKHDVNVYRFDETNQPLKIAAFRQQGGEELAATMDLEAGLSELRTWTRGAGIWLAVALLALFGHWVLGRWVRNREGESWAFCLAVFCGIAGLATFAVGNLRHPELGPRVALGLAAPVSDGQASEVSDDALPLAAEPETEDWSSLLKTAGGATRIGDAVRSVLTQERGTPLAGIGLITDGNSNRGLELSDAGRLAAAAEVPLYPIGIGSERPPTNFRVVDLEAPLRVYPGDEFKMTGYVQAYGLQGKTVDLRLVSRPQDQPSAEPVLEAGATLELAEDGVVMPVPLQVTPEAVGKRIYEFQLESQVDTDTTDNVISAKVQIIERKSRVLLLAGGPTREYRFVRNLLHRDREVSVDVLLQTAADGVSQEASDILFDLPRDPAELYEYDAMIAFDPNWLAFDADQLQLIEQWVAEKAGGLVVVAGPVHTAAWAEDRRAPAAIATIKQLYPVTFNTSRIELGRYGSATAWPLAITEDGASIGFLAVNEDDLEPQDVWDQFAGVFGYYPVRSVKPAATVYARFSDPEVLVSETQPPLVVGQYYGAGRVVFLGTGEFWRLRALDEGYFERLYTKLVRYVSEGRLLRDSNRGLLLVDKDRAMRGDTVGIRASVLDAQFEPWRDPEIALNVRRPDGSDERLTMALAEGGRDGMYAARYVVSQPGDYQLTLVLPGEGDPVILQRDVRVRLPNLEIEQPQRNDATLAQLASATAGHYFVGMASTSGTTPSLATTVPSKRRETYLPGTPDRNFQQQWMAWLLALICGALCLEWTIRRLSKLA